MEAGPAMDELVATKVMGWHKDHLLGKYWQDSNDNLCRLVEFESDTMSDPFNPSTDIAAAWQVVEHLNREEPFLHLYWDARGDDGPYWFCDWSNQYQSGIGAKADTAPLAICLAALKAAGVEI